MNSECAADGAARRLITSMSALTHLEAEFGLAPLQSGMLHQALLEQGSAESAGVLKRDTTPGREFFRRQLHGKSEPTPLPGAERVALEARGSGTRTALLEQRASARLHTLARESGTSLGTVLQAAWSVFLARWTGDEDVLFGSTRAFGMFVNTAPVRVCCSDQRTLREVLEELRSLGLAMREHEHTPLVEIQDVSEIPRSLPIFETVLVFEGQELDARWTRCPLELTASGGERMQLRLRYDRSRYRESTVERMLAHLVALLTRIGEHLDRPIGLLECIPDEERQQTLFGWNATAHPFREDLCIHQLFEEQVELRPSALALACDGATLTFRELEERSNRIANTLLARGIGPGSRVAFLLDRSLDLVATMIGIAKSGAAYVPIDPSYPVERARFIVQDTQAALMITEPLFAERCSGMKQLMLGAPELVLASSLRPAAQSSADDVCYVIYTSGSTGVPKGVVLRHRAVVNTIEWVNRTFGVGAHDRLLFVTSPGFDLSVYDVFGALGAGATVEIASTKMMSEPALLAAKLSSPGITIWDSAPPTLSQLVPLLPPRAPSSTLRVALLSGDWIPVRLPDELRAVFPLVKPISLGGATETAVWSIYHEIGTVDPAWRSIPYGKPIQNARCYVLDRRLRPVPVGLAGDLHIGGACLAQGYHGREQLTAERFVADPFLPGEQMYKTGDLARYCEDGTLEFLGRVDFQVKVRGFRVELGEIEVELRKQQGVREAVCSTRVDASGEKSIVAYVVPEDGVTLQARSLRRALVGALPIFMVPSVTVILERLPLTGSGKLDRNALPDPALVLDPRGTEPARTPLEAQFVALWEELLELKPIGVRDDFFEFGGHSLLALMFVTRVESELGLRLPLSSMLTMPTIAELAKSLEPAPATERTPAPPPGPLVELNAGGDRPPIFLVAGAGGQVFVFRELARSLGPDQPVFAFTIEGGADEGLPARSVEDVASSCEREIDRRGVPNAPLIFAGYSFGGLVAFELALRFRARGHEVGRIIAFDGTAPGYLERAPYLERARTQLRALSRGSTADRLRYPFEQGVNLGRQLLSMLGLGRRPGPSNARSIRANEERSRRICRLVQRAQDSYVPLAADDGPLLLFASEMPARKPVTRMLDPALGWGRWIRGRIDVVPVKGGHVDVFRSDNVERMASAIRSSIDAVARRRAPLTTRTGAHLQRIAS